jgi:ubiquinone/menaquinone biosynthesis C-methylase UbiE
LNINKVLSTKAGIGEKDHVLDAGCGIGGSSLWLAKNVGCQVTGIALNEKQLETARNFSQQEQLDSQVTFKVADFTNTDFADGSFDVVWAIESVCHAGNKSSFLKEAYRLLKPGGRLIMTDYFKKPGLSVADENIIYRWIRGWAINEIPVLDEFIELAVDIGFTIAEIENASNAIMRSSKRMARAFYLGIFPSLIYNLLHKNVSAHGKNNVIAAYYQYKGLRRGAWDYMIVSGVKK